MAIQVNLCYVFLLAFHFSLVSCIDYYLKNFDGEGELSTESSSSSATDALFAENVIAPKDNSFLSSNNDAYEQNSSVMSESYTSDDGNPFPLILIRWGVGIGIIIVIGLIIYCITICCSCCCRGKESRGFVIRSNTSDQHANNIIQPLIPQAVAVQHFPPETQLPRDPPPYDTQPMQQNFQYLPKEYLLQQNPVQPMGQQQFHQPLTTQDYSIQATAIPPYPTKC